MNVTPIGWCALVAGLASSASLLIAWRRGHRPLDAVMVQTSSGGWSVPVPRGDVPALFGADFLAQAAALPRD